MEWNDGRLTRPADTLLDFHRRKLAELLDKGYEGIRPTYHQERVDYLSKVVGENVIQLSDYIKPPSGTAS